MSLQVREAGSMSLQVREAGSMSLQVHGVAAVVLAARGERLSEALASVAWAEERIVADPTGRLAERPLPDGVLRARDGLAAARAPWVLLLREQETVAPELAAAIASVTAAADGTEAYRIGQAVAVAGRSFTLRGAPVRLGARAGARLVVGRALGPELAVADGRVGRLPGRLVSRAAPSLAAALDELDGETTALAALLRADDVRPTLAHLALAPLLPVARSLFGSGPLGAAWQRWTLGAFAGFGVVTTYAKLWELRRAEESSPR
jgi:hypothetical protein